MFETHRPRIDPDVLVERVREFVARSGQTESAAAVDDSPPPSFAELEAHLSTARAKWQVGVELPPMSRRKGWIRRLAVPSARVVLRIAQLVTRDQRDFNQAALGALQKLQEAVQRALRNGAAAAGESRSAAQKAAEATAKVEALERAVKEQAAVIAGLRQEIRELKVAAGGARHGDAAE